MPNAELNRHLEACQGFTMITAAFMYGSISELSDVMQNIQDAIWCSTFVLHFAKQIGLCIDVLNLNAHLGRVPFSEPLAKLPKLDQTRAWIILEIAFCELAKVCKFYIQIIEKLKITNHLSGHAMSTS